MADETAPSLLDQLLDGWKAALSSAPDTLAKGLGVWTAARAAIQTVASGVANAATLSTVTKANAKYQGMPLTPASLADMIVRNVLPDSTGQAGTPGANYPAPMINGVEGNTPTQEAELSGLSGNRFAALVADTGESYGIDEALRLYNRGLSMYGLSPGPDYSTGTPLYVSGDSLQATYGITEAELDRVIAYSRIRPEFTPDILKLARNTLSPADAVEMAVKQIVSVADAQKLYEAAGGVPEQFGALVDAAGDAAGLEKAIELAAHGVIDAGQLKQVVGMSRINPRFYYLTEPVSVNGVEQPLYTAPLNRKWLPPYEIREAMTAGTITADQALTWMLEQGFSQAEAAAFAGAASSGATTTAKQETEAMVLDEYQAGMLSEDEATTALTNLGYTKASIPYLLQYAQAKAVISARNAAVSRVRAGYLLGLLDNDQATTDLTKAGVPQAAITTLLADWAIELAVPRTALSTAQIGKLVEDGAMTSAQATTFWQMRGYTSTDIGWLFVLYPPPAAPAVTPPANVEPL